MADKLSDASYGRYVVGDTDILFFSICFPRDLKKSLGFVFKEILITHIQRKPKKSHKQKLECAFPIRTMYN